MNTTPRKPTYWDKLSSEEKQEWRGLYGIKGSEPVESARKDDGPSLGKALLILSGVLIVLAILGTLVPSKDQPASDTISERMPGKREAYSAMKDIIRPLLRAPSTAKFQSAWDITMYQEGPVYRASFWVDAQNGFGAMIRDTYTLQLRREDNEVKKWVLEEMDPRPSGFQ